MAKLMCAFRNVGCHRVALPCRKPAFTGSPCGSLCNMCIVDQSRLSDDVTLRKRKGKWKCLTLWWRGRQGARILVHFSLDGLPGRVRCLPCVIWLASLSIVHIALPYPRWLTYNQRPKCRLCVKWFSVNHEATFLKIVGHMPCFRHQLG